MELESEIRRKMALMLVNEPEEKAEESYLLEEERDRLKAAYEVSFKLQWAQQRHLCERIYAASEMSSINYILQHPYRDLAVFDIDDTLVASIHPYFDVHYWPNTPLNQRLLASNKAIRDRFFFGILPTNPFTLLELQTPELITNLQSHGIKVIALTALQPFIQKDLNIPNWRVKHLMSFGYNFSKSFPISLLYGFDRSGSQGIPEPYFKKGVMFSGSIPKGRALLSFLRIISFKPRSVLFVDDNFDNVCSVYRELSFVGIECHAILYTRTHKCPAKSMFSQEEYDCRLQNQVQIVVELLQENTINSQELIAQPTNSSEIQTKLTVSLLSAQQALHPKPPVAMSFDPTSTPFRFSATQLQPLSQSIQLSSPNVEESSLPRLPFLSQWEQWKKKYNEEHPSAENNGYGPGAIVVHSPRGMKQFSASK